MTDDSLTVNTAVCVCKGSTEKVIAVASGTECVYIIDDR